ncbi:MAG TPA: S9 family peptidase [Caldithrix abyssi]|uniref:S9 family peptidase n=1 Tax=Caldithrix abyssi TaxID=187145 RepID=A0A7V5RMU7_CALAY|nr:S9 family peptidase [Caldithrix abyssi]
MKYFIAIFLMFGALLPAKTPPAKKELSLETIFQSPAFSLDYISAVQWLPGNRGLTYLKSSSHNKKSIYLFDLKNKKERLLIDGAALIRPGEEKPLNFSSYQWIENGQKVLFKADVKRIWRHSTVARYFIYDLASATFHSLIKGDPYVSNAKISPDKKWVGYVKKNNIFAYNTESGQTIQLTHDGNADIINGAFDWVYEEEFAISDGWRWSPDSKRIAYWRLDQSPEPTFSWVDFEPLNGRVETIRYPKAGQHNARVKIGVVTLAGAKTQWMDIGEETDIYIPRLSWMNADILLIQRLNRHQNKMELLRALPADGTSEVLMVEEDSAWVDIHDNFFFVDDNHFIWTSERSGFNHIYLVDARNGNTQALTDGSWEVSDVYGANANHIYFRANRERSTEWNIYRLNRKTGDIRLIAPEAGVHSANFSPDYRFFIDNWSAADTPNRSLLKKEDGAKMAALVENDLNLEDYDFIFPEFGQFTTSDGIKLNTRTFLPANFDPAKKYPVVIYGYGGPASQIVVNRWGRTREVWFSWLAKEGYMVFTLDNRGTGARGKAFKNLAYGDLSKYAVKDHIEGAKYLATLPYVDKERIAIWGWSGGGYLTLNCMFRGAEYFKVGMAVAPVTDFRLYDTIWTERYMGLPGENKAGYDAANTLNYYRNLKGKLLIVHGTADDNVHFQNTMQLAKRLQRSALQFDLMVYPGLNHALNAPNSYLHLFTMMSNYLKKNL